MRLRLKIFCLFISLIAGITTIPALSDEPYCNVTTYGDLEGIPSYSGTSVVQDKNGILWISTWNGLYRWDGYEFCPIRPADDNEVRKYSSRYRSITEGPDGKLWCRIDEKAVLFDVDTYEFFDLHPEIEKRLGREIKVGKFIRQTKAGDMVLGCSDGCLLLFDGKKLMQSGSNPLDAMREAADDAEFRYKRNGTRRISPPSSFAKEKTAYCAKDDSGNIWVITKAGQIYRASGDNGPYEEVTAIDFPTGILRFGCEDNQGNVWMVSSSGLHRIAFGTTPVTTITPPQQSMLRASMLDSREKLWLSWSDAGYVCVYDSVSGSPRYVAADGDLTEKAVKFGAPVYSITEGYDGQIWLGSKPDGLFRLSPRPEGGGYKVEHISKCGSKASRDDGNSYYDATTDSYGRLWLATMGSGIEIIENPSATSPRFISLSEIAGYPEEAMMVRRIRIMGDSLVVATTTEGLLSFPMPANTIAGKIDFTLHRSIPGNIHALGNIATMDALSGSDGRLYVATESDGVNVVSSPLSTSGEWKFSRNLSDNTTMAETALALAGMPEGRILVVGRKDINMIDQSGDGCIDVIGRSFWKKDYTFKEVSPLRLPDGRWLAALNNGAVAIDFQRMLTDSTAYPVEFTSCSIEGRPSEPLSHTSDTIVLRPDERTLSLTFAALCFSDASAIRYAYRHDDRDSWTQLGNLRTLTLTHLDPGTYRISVRSTDRMGRWLDNSRTIVVRVMPKFRETIWAKLIVGFIILALIAGLIWIYVYMQRIKQRQRETLEAYLNLLESRAADSTKQEETEAEPQPRQPDVNLSEEDKEIIIRVVEYIDTNYSDSSISVEDIASAVAISKSSLTRKMKSLMGVTPADFLKTTRLSKSKTMLKDTDLPIKDIAFDCGFSDMNYFGKCFKSAFGISPGAFRKNVEC